MFLDVDITIQPRTAEGYPVTLHAPAGDADGVFVFPDDPAFQQALVRFATLQTDQETLVTIGQRLFVALFSPPLHDLFVRSRAMCAPDQQLRLRLVIAAEEGKIAALPWELICDPADGSLARFGMSVVRYVQVAARPPLAAAPLPLRVLLAGTASPETAIVLNEIQAALKTLGNHVQVTVELQLTSAVFGRRLREGFHVWHFVGQANTNNALVFDNNRGTKAVHGSRIAALLHGSGVRLVLLDASTSPRLATEPFRTLAPMLLQTDASTVIASQFRAPRAGQVFAAELYRGLIQGLPVDECVVMGRQAVARASGAELPDWATPVVYTRAPESHVASAPQTDMPTTITTLNHVSGLPLHTTLAVDTTHGTLLYAGSPPRIERRKSVSTLPIPLGFLDRERELRFLQAKFQPQQRIWLYGQAGAGVSALLRRAATTDAANALPDGVFAPANAYSTHAEDILQVLFDHYYSSSTPVKLITQDAASYLAGLRALVVLDHGVLPANEAARFASVLSESAILTTVEGRAPNQPHAITLGSLPRQDATRLLGAEAGTDIDLSNVMFLDRICAAMDDMPMALQLAGRLIRTKTVGIKQLVAFAEERSEEPVALVRAATLVLRGLGDADRQALACIVRVGPAGGTMEGIIEISQIAPPQLQNILETLVELRLVENSGTRFMPSSGSLNRILDRLLHTGDQKRRAAHYYATAAETRMGDLEWLAAEEANIAQAVQTLLVEGAAVQAGMLARALQPHAVLSGKWGLWSDLAIWVERSAAASNDQVQRAWALHERGTRLGMLGDISGAKTALEQAHRIRLERGDTSGAAWSQHNLRHIGAEMPAPATSATMQTQPSRRWFVIAAAIVLLFALAARGLAGFAPQNSESTPTAAPVIVLAATEVQPAGLQPTVAQLPTNQPTPFATSAPTIAATSQIQPTAIPTCQVVATQLNVRSGPGIDYAVIGVLTNGDQVTPIGRSSDPGWLYARTSAGEGWMTALEQFVSCSIAPANLSLISSPPSP